MDHQNEQNAGMGWTGRVREDLRGFGRVLGRLHRDDRGAEALEKLLIVAVVVLPLLGLLIFFRERINTWVNQEWDTVTQQGTDTTPPSAVPGSGG